MKRRENCLTSGHAVQCCQFIESKLFILQQEIAECVSELETLGFREEVLRKEKELLSQFARHISKTHSVKVGAWTWRC